MSGFTALNGSSPKVAPKPVTSSSDPDTQNVTADEQPKAPASTPAPAVEAAPIQAAAPQSASTPASASASAPVPTTKLSTELPFPLAAPASEIAVAALASASEAQSPNQRESWPTQGLERTPPVPAPSESDSSNKRKRSHSNEGRTQLPTQPVKRIQKATDRTHERTPESATVTSQSNGDYYGSESPTGEGHVSTSPQHQSSPPSVPIRASAEHLSQRQASGQVEYTPVTPQNNGQALAQYQSPSYSESRSGAVVQHDPKKRKRNFSNRTKTGCLTCRRRKKKCDEAKPECNNCIKGAFVCAGYPPQRGAGWPKLVENKPGGVPLESKDPNYVPPGAYGMPASPYTSSQAANNGQPSGPKREPLPQYRGQNLRIEPPKGADAPSGSPEHKQPPAPFTPGANAYPTPVSANTQPPAFGDRVTNDYQRHHEGHAPPVSSAQIAAQMALSHAQAQPHSMTVAPYDQRRPTQKEEMLQGGYFYQYDTELSLERDRAATACWRFNKLTYPPTNGVSTEERARLFLEIIQPRESSSFPAEEASGRSNVGRVGRHVAVESPFHCDYGYNISIGNNVSIGKGCTMNDAGKIQIGDNCIIGPNVSMYTIELSTDPKHRQGGHGAQLGKSIIIDSDCWIGGGVIIMPGKVIGKGSTVGAGSVVTKDVPPFTVVAGNPARVLRGVASI
ncbi:C6 zinc finger domain-containing protein [Cordyceps fumosorosea ARSEF 2679]|uniref:C6 zinc finger domain-containing protein n=1 Tax=Cordyceps fumosorosea (strain ARSEF 2679) TaxID=1081104 RepID=A0A167TLM9_CORFA|nr:C6 zinc finger domain-containing protein [Cordyceps fumosorosea ARSEF 2679]OAA60726.1 C6 zinc finger domain-containing protein [Cordyceps fumosorosea ARSEF 2679]